MNASARTRRPDASEELQQFLRHEERGWGPFVSDVFRRAIRLGGTHLPSVVSWAQFFCRVELTDEDRTIYRTGGDCTPRIWLRAALRGNRVGAMQYARRLIEREGLR